MMWVQPDRPWFYNNSGWRCGFDDTEINSASSIRTLLEMSITTPTPTPRSQRQHFKPNANANVLNPTPVANTPSVEPNANTSTMGILVDSRMGFGSGNSEDDQEKLEHGKQPKLPMLNAAHRRRSDDVSHPFRTYRGLCASLVNPSDSRSGI